MTSALPAVLFDLDGTLVDSEPVYFEAARRLLEPYGVAYTWEEHAAFIGIGTRETVEALRARHRLGPPLDALLAEKNRLYLELTGANAKAFPRMRELVVLLREAGHPMAVASGSSRVAIDLTLEAAGLAGLLPVRLSAEEVERGKPAPDVFLAAARRLGAAPGDCVVFEDSGPGVEAAHRAGMRCAAVPYPADRADDPAYATAGLLVRGGQERFDARTAYAWLAAAPR